MKKALGLSAVALLLLSCGNKIRQEHESAMVEAESEEALLQPDTIVTEEVKGKQEEVKASSSPTSASSHSHESGDYDNIRGFDPATEDDMDDNGMSRYMENNDEEGWD